MGKNKIHLYGHKTVVPPPHNIQVPLSTPPPVFLEGRKKMALKQSSAVQVYFLDQISSTKWKMEIYSLPLPTTFLFLLEKEIGKRKTGLSHTSFKEKKLELLILKSWDNLKTQVFPSTHKQDLVTWPLQRTIALTHTPLKNKKTTNVLWYPESKQIDCGISFLEQGSPLYILPIKISGF